MLWHKLWHSKFHNDEIEKNEYIHFNGCKVHCVSNKNNLLCASGYTYVMMLIVDKIWRKPLNWSKYGKIRHIITWGKGLKGQDFLLWNHKSKRH